MNKGRLPVQTDASVARTPGAGRPAMLGAPEPFC